MKKFIQCFALCLTAYLPCSLIAANGNLDQELLVRGSKTRMTAVVTNFSAGNFSYSGDAVERKIGNSSSSGADLGTGKISASLTLVGDIASKKAPAQAQVTLVAPAFSAGEKLKVALIKQAPGDAFNDVADFVTHVHVPANTTEEAQVLTLPISIPADFLADAKQGSLIRLVIERKSPTPAHAPTLLPDPITHPAPLEFGIIVIGLVIAYEVYAAS